jgi:hypothetical protein
MSSESVLRIFLETLLGEMRCGSMSLASASLVARKCEALSRDRGPFTAVDLIECCAGYPHLVRAFDGAIQREIALLERRSYNKIV